MLFQNFSSHLCPVENDQSTMVGATILQHAKIINRGGKENTKAFCNWLAYIEMSVAREELHKVGVTWRGYIFKTKTNFPPVASWVSLLELSPKVFFLSLASKRPLDVGRILGSIKATNHPM
ncbi:hypothetical protein AMTRI_Chr12g241760 [Amborella trichopoda]